MNKLILLTSVAMITIGITSESWAVTCEFNNDPNNEGKYTLIVKGDAGGSEFTTSSCNNDLPQEYSSWNQIKSKITSASFDNNITSIGSSAFQSAKSLTSIDMPNVTSVGRGAFAWANSLKGVDMPNVTTVGGSAFQETTSLTHISMPNVTEIGVFAFYGDTALSYIEMSDSGVTIGKNAFTYMKWNEYYSLPIMSSCGSSDGYQVCTTCTSSQVYQPDTGCASACSTGYTANGHGFCQKNPTQVAQNNQQGTGGGTGTGSGTDTGGSQESGQQGSQVSEQATSAADCAASGKYWQEGKCVSSCGASFKLNDGWCDRQRYTPAEATAVLTNDNNNSVIITFKK